METATLIQSGKNLDQLVVEPFSPNPPSPDSYLDLLNKIIQEGFQPSTYKQFQEKHHRSPRLIEVLQPVHLLVDYPHQPALSPLYALYGKKIQEDFYQKSTPPALFFFSAQSEKTLTDSLRQSFAQEKKQSYTPNLRFKIKKQDGKAYSLFLDWSRLDREEAFHLINKLYSPLKNSSSLEIHSPNACYSTKDIHQALGNLSLLHAFEETACSILKLTTSHFTLCLKKNETYHLAFKIRGSPEEIIEQSWFIESFIQEHYQKQFSEALEP